jgi:hypothetical protein
MEALHAEEFQAVVNTQALEPRDESYLLIPEITLPEVFDGVLRITSMIPEQVEISKPR